MRNFLLNNPQRLPDQTSRSPPPPRTTCLPGLRPHADFSSGTRLGAEGSFRLQESFDVPLGPPRAKPPVQLLPPPPSPRLRQPLGARRGFESSPKGRGKAANKAAERAGTDAPPAPGAGEERRRLPVLARAAGSQLLTSAPAGSGDNSESHQSRRDFRAPSCERRLRSHPSPWPNLRRWEKPTRGAGEGQAGAGTFPAARPTSVDLGREI